MELQQITHLNDFLQTKSVGSSNFLSTSSINLGELLYFWALKQINVPKSSVTNLLKLLRTFKKIYLNLSKLYSQPPKAKVQKVLMKENTCVLITEHCL